MSKQYKTKTSLTENYFYNLIYQVCTFLPLLIITPYLSRVLGAEKIGIYSFTSSILSYFILFGCLGINLYGQREIAAFQHNIEKRSKIFYELVFLKTIFIFISTLVFIITCCRDPIYSVYYKILTIQLIFNIFDISWFYQGIEDFKTIAFQNLIIKILLTASVFIFVRSSDSLIIYFAIMVLINSFSWLLLWFNLNKYLVKVNLKELNLFKHLKDALMIFIPQIAIQIYTVLDKTMLGWILNDMREVGYYEQSQKLIHICLMIITSFGTVMVPRISNLHAENKEEELNQRIVKSFNVVSFIAFPMCFGLMAITSNFVPWFFGIDFLPTINLISILCFLFLAIGFNNITGIQYAISTNNQHKFTVSVLIGAIVNAILNLILIPIFKSSGAALASVIAETIIFIIQIFYFKKTFNFKSIFMTNIKYCYYSIIMFVFIFLIGKILPINIISTLIQILCGIIIYLLMLVLTKDQFLIEIFNKFKIKFIHSK